MNESQCVKAGIVTSLERWRGFQLYTSYSGQLAVRVNVLVYSEHQYRREGVRKYACTVYG